MKSFFKLGLALLVGCLVIGSADDLFAQEVARGILEGVVWDQDKNPVEGAIITLTGPQGVRSQVTDSYGRYQFRDLIPGEYSVKAESEGRATVVQTAVDVSIGMRTQLPFMLSAGVDETIEVVSEAPVVDLKSTAVGALISTEDLVQRIPLGRNFAQMFTLSPGVSTGLAAGAGNFSVSGSTGLENSYLIDGVNVTNSGYGGIGSYNRVFGSLGTGVTNDFIEQVEIKEGGFEAEFGQATGGVMNAVVKSGTNDFQGGLSVYLEPGSMESPRRLFANNPESVTVNETDTQDFALDLGGPIIQDKLFWFAAVNPVSTETEFTRLVEDESILFDSLGNLIDPAQPSGGRTETRERTSTNWAAKVSWFVTPNHRIELTGFGDPSDGDFGPQRRTSLSRIGSEGFSELDYGGESYSIKYFGAITSDLFVDAIFARRESELFETGAPLYSVFDVDRNVPGGGIGFSPDTDESIDQLSVKFTYVLGNHEFKLGYQEDDIEYSEAGRQTGPLYNLNLPIAEFTTVTVDPDGTPGNGDEFDVEDWFWTGDTQEFTSTTGAFIEKSELTPGVFDLAVQRSRFSPVEVLTKNTEKNIFFSWTYNPIPEVTIKAGLRHTDEQVTGGEPFVLPFDVVRNAGNRHYDLDDDGTDDYDFLANRSRMIDLSNPQAFNPGDWNAPTETVPRIGVTWDVNGDGRNKLYLNYAQYAQRITQDLAYRALSNEVDVRQSFTATAAQLADSAFVANLLNNADPLITEGGCPGTSITDATPTDSTTNADCQIITAAAGLGGPAGIATGSELPKTEEFLVGYTRELTPTMSLDARWIHRELDTVLEDFSYTPQESINNFLWGTGLGFPFDPFPEYPVGFFGEYVLANPSVNSLAAISQFEAEGLIETEIAELWQTGVVQDFPKPTRDYDALEFVLNKRFSDNWVLWASYRWSKLRGNYEGLLRNDNGQDDPNITSLYDFPNTPLMSGQFLIGPLNGDVTHNLKATGSYTTDFGLEIGAGVGWSTGTPRFTQLLHPNDFYQLPANGEVPGKDPVYGSWTHRIDVVTLEDVGFDGEADTDDDGVAFLVLSPGIGASGTMASTGELDSGGALVFDDYSAPNPVVDGVYDELSPGLVADQFLYSYKPIPRDDNGHTEDVVSVDVRLGYTFENLGWADSSLKLMLDVFNIFDSQATLTFDDVLELQQATPNPNFGRPGGNFYPFQGPRQIRLGARWSF